MKGITMQNIALLFGALIIMAGLTGCSNTFDGIGQDLKNTGGWIEETF